MPDDFDVRVIMGATQLELTFITAPDVKSYQEVKGKAWRWMRCKTGFAFVLYDMLAAAGLTPDDYKIVPVGATPERWDAVRRANRRDADHRALHQHRPRAASTCSMSAARHFPAYQGGIVAGPSRARRKSER